jgi:cytochrome c oxidase subunit 1
VTSVLDAEPSHRHTVHGPSLAPLLTGVATAVTFIGGIFTPWLVVVGAGLTLIALTLWFWPHAADVSRLPEPP